MATNADNLSSRQKQPQYPNPIHPMFMDRLDSDFVEYYNQYIAIKPATHGVTIQDIRAAPKKYASPWYRDFTYEPFVNDIQITSDDGHKFTARIYAPDSRTSRFGSGPYPVHINFHGGGYALGDLTGDAELCMLVRNRVGITVIDVDYRLTPEHTFLRGHDDCWAAIRWVHAQAAELNVCKNSISIGGISAGGHISAVWAFSKTWPPKPLTNVTALEQAILAVPATTSHLGLEKASDSPFPSFTENEVAPCLDWARMKFFMDHAQPTSEAARAELEKRPQFFSSPIDGDVRGVCDTFIATAERDPLRDEGEAYGQKLIQAGVRVAMRRYTGVPHPFMHMLVVKKAQMYMDDVCSELRRAHNA
ncbi:hypothetical protein QQS21_007999 [Conoideocrella luteorostrata]|uniref:Alpha/beta hydrolase fold-3 domain-containing protein n=1 Tax=Conoideocrella luteorostrata TaxID=1105319 RepID=A0AAJ0CJN6_9HYPO|nr:hypothetical protein QQS21_007999 [Conoideocrella luteorostrata]